MLSKKDLLNYSILLISISISFSIVVLFENPLSHVIAVWLLAMTASFIARFEIAHPLVWFSNSFALYSTAYVLMYSLGYTTYSGYTKDNILLTLVALSIVVLIIGVKKIDRPDFHKINKLDLLSDKNNKKIIEYILFILIIILFICNMVIFITPFEGKADLLSSKNYFFIIGAYSSRFLSFFCSFYILLFINIDKKKTFFFIITSAVLVVALSLFTGERDVMFRFFVVLIMTLSILAKISKKTVIALIPLGVIYLIASRYFKYYFVRGEIKQTQDKETFLYSFLSSDFSAAGENVQVLLNNSWTESSQGFKLIAIDFISPFIPGGIFTNVGVWFNDTFFFNSYSRAFTLVGQGYVIGGITGVIAVFLILGIGIKYLYRKITVNVYWLVIYIYSIPIIIFSFRSILGSAITGLIRVAFFSVVIHAFLLILVNKDIKSKRSKN